MFGPKELVVVLIVLVIVVFVFGPKRVKSLGSELGNAIKGFRRAVSDKDAEAAESEAAAESAPDPLAREPQESPKASADRKQHV